MNLETWAQAAPRRAPPQPTRSEKTMGYTSTATMDEPALRDVERWKDKIEVRLDNRQVFFLFFGSAVVACLLFVLGVIVGKRLESRGRAEAPEAQDPLALLDRVAAAPSGAGDETLTFPKALLTVAGKGGAADGGRLGPKPAAPAGKGTPQPVKPSPTPVARPALAAAAQPAAVVANPVAASAKARAEATPPTRSAEVAPIPAPAKVALASAPSPSAPLPSPSASPVASPAKAAPKAAAASPVAGEARGRYTLQLSAFQDRAEAEGYAKRFAAEGPFVVASEIPGKGTWFRVRVGSYGSAREAAAAKTAFERRYNTIAYVAGGPTK